ncbi:hypothetical protein T4B_10853 [Trichinella pseudospiralis]|uniref:Uncharacterized protein n=1 Tax=Trichinella pseudospiralis TaxID=6337 RepID=A0A0V1IDK9_TRIPS|nr:hypothetical protein T4B_10853 [Trichinella pseudospiralis]
MKFDRNEKQQKFMLDYVTFLKSLFNRRTCFNVLSQNFFNIYLHPIKKNFSYLHITYKEAMYFRFVDMAGSVYEVELVAK